MRAMGDLRVGDEMDFEEGRSRVVAIVLDPVFGVLVTLRDVSDDGTTASRTCTIPLYLLIEIEDCYRDIRMEALLTAA